MSNSLDSNLILGWQVTSAHEPVYWLDTSARAGFQPEDELIKVSAESVANHTAIIAQSGSGKSFFLGRLIEEILLRTKADCLVFDPNADFRKANQIEDRSLWEDAKYDTIKQRGKLPHEKSWEEFKAEWLKIPITIRQSGLGSTNNPDPLVLWWPSLSADFMSEDLDSMLRSELYHCHSFVQALAVLAEIKSLKTNQEIDIFDQAQELFPLMKANTGNSVDSKEFDTFEKGKEAVSLGHFWKRVFSYLNPPIQKDSAQKVRSALRRLVGIPPEPDFLQRAIWRANIEHSLQIIQTAPKYVSNEVQRFYFSKIGEYRAAGIIKTTTPRGNLYRPFFQPMELVKESTFRARVRLEVIDLPSLDSKSTRLLAINSLLTMKWHYAQMAWEKALKMPASEDQRTPLFIVVDEAHNLIPAEVRSRAEIALREQFRTIIAEGRKYGLFLILVTQRPDKLDPLILSECENKAIMKLSSPSVLRITKKMLGLEDLPPSLLDQCLTFKTGRALLCGRWSAEHPQILYSAARRTIEGGRNLQPDYWAVSSSTQ